MDKSDLRVKKTNQALQLAFLKLANAGDYRSITVKKLTEEAHINRRTFYLHFDSIDDFADTLVDEISEKLVNLILENPLDQEITEPGDIFDKVVDFFQKSREFYTFMMTSNDYSFLARDVENKVAQEFAKAIHETFDISKLDAFISANFLIQNTLMLFRMYNDDRINLERNELRDRLIRLDSSGLSSFVDGKLNIRK